MPTIAPAAPVARPLFSGAVHVERLANGTQLVVRDRPGAPSVELSIGTRIASLQDPVGQAGAAHLFEHLAFEAAGDWTAADVRNEREALGGVSNGLTNLLDTHFDATVAVADAGRGTQLLLDRYLHPATDGGAIDRQRPIVHQELREANDATDRRSDLVLQHLLYGRDAGPVVNGPLGLRSELATITPADAASWMARTRTGANTVALVDGDLAKVPMQRLRSALGALPAGAPEPDAAPPALLRGGSLVAVPGGGEGGQVRVVLPLAEGGSAQGLPLLREIVGERLRDRLRQQDDIVYSVQARQASQNGTPMLSIGASFGPKQVRQGTAAIAQELQRLHDGGVTDAEVERAQRNLASIAAMHEYDATDDAEDAYFAELARDGVPREATPSASVATTAPGATTGTGAPTVPAKVDMHVAVDDLARRLLRFDDARVLVTGTAGDRRAQVRAGLTDAGVSAEQVRNAPYPRAFLRREVLGD